jgi:phosphatidylglycerol:prolipoprotein diacylglycerol transferase
MRPELFRIGPFAVHSYGLMLALGFGLGIVVLVRRGRARGLDAGRMIDLSLVMVVVGMLGGRLMYALTHWGEFAARPWRVLWPIQSNGMVGLQGFVYYGGIVLALPVAVLLVRRWRLDPWKVLDAGAPGLALGTAVGRIGCFLNGCCFGRPSLRGRLPPRLPGRGDLPRHPRPPDPALYELRQPPDRRAADPDRPPVGPI